jgi:hypothetical protein
MPRLSSAAQHKGKGSGKATPPASPPTKRGLSKAAKRAATIAAKNAEDREAEAQDDDDEEDKVSSDMDSDRNDGTDGSSSAGSDISEDTKAELVKLIAHRRAAKKRKLSQNSTSAVVTAAAARVSIDKAARTKTRVDSSAKKAKRKAALSSDEDDEESHDVVELPAVPAKTRRIRTTVNKLISWLSKSSFTLLPTSLPAFALAEGHLSLVYTAALLTVSAWYPPGAQPTCKMYLGLLEVVQRSLPQLFTGSPDNLPIANLHVFEIMTNFKAQLDQAFRNVEGQQVLPVIDLTFSAFITQLCADGHAFDPVAAVVKLMSALSNSMVAKKTKKSITTAATVPAPPPLCYRTNIRSSGSSSSNSSTSAGSSRIQSGAKSSACSAVSRSSSTAARCSGRVSSAAPAPIGEPKATMLRTARPRTQRSRLGSTTAKLRHDLRSPAR